MRRHLGQCQYRLYSAGIRHSGRADYSNGSVGSGVGNRNGIRSPQGRQSSDQFGDWRMRLPGRSDATLGDGFQRKYSSSKFRPGRCNWSDFLAGFQFRGRSVSNCAREWSSCDRGARKYHDCRQHTTRASHSWEFACAFDFKRTSDIPHMPNFQYSRVCLRGKRDIDDHRAGRHDATGCRRVRLERYADYGCSDSFQQQSTGGSNSQRHERSGDWSCSGHIVCNRCVQRNWMQHWIATDLQQRGDSERNGDHVDDGLCSGEWGYESHPDYGQQQCWNRHHSA